MTDSVSSVATAVLPMTMRVAAPVTPVEPTPDAASRRSSGNAAPEGGEELPLAGPATKQSLAQAADRLNEILSAAERRIRFRLDDASGKTLIFVVDASTGEVVRQIPEEHLLTLSRRFDMHGSILDAEV